MLTRTNYHPPHNKAIQVIADLSTGILLVSAICIFLLGIYRASVQVQGSSMSPTFENGDEIIVTRIWKDLSYGDIVVINLDSSNPLGERTIIKRVVATEGQIISVSEDGIVYIDGSPEQIIYPNIQDAGILSHTYTVPTGHVFVLGDNRNNSIDSRVIGAIPISQIYGKYIASKVDKSKKTSTMD